ncbi:MAG: diaminopimelate epimerase [Peptococcaceae bacterium BICA1-8]|nr:MAG: diaminopimelate epimerase [Peptococcaceae bacterium BICA1-8]
MSYNYFKYHALGNDYIVIDPNNSGINLNTENIKLICHRNFGIGSDGILYGPIFNEKEIGLKILNPDGSEAEKSGNGIRIFSKYLLDAGYIKDRKFSLNTLGGKVAVEVLDAKGQLIKVDMGVVTFLSNEIPVDGKPREVINEVLEIDNKNLKITCLSIGNPHCVIPMVEISEDIVKLIGPEIENNPIFPNRINVQLLKVLDRNNIQIEIWERGAGYTLASGSSSCAAASAAFKLGLVDNEIKVHMPGGVIEVDIKNDGHVLMTGSVNSVSKGVFTEEFWMDIT